MINTIVKRDGRCVLFDIDKLTDGVAGARRQRPANRPGACGAGGNACGTGARGR